MRTSRGASCQGETQIIHVLTARKDTGEDAKYAEKIHTLGKKQGSGFRARRLQRDDAHTG